eukprot:4694325-Prymnesium_polylepis.1
MDVTHEVTLTPRVEDFSPVGSPRSSAAGASASSGGASPLSGSLSKSGDAFASKPADGEGAGEGT